MKKWLNGSIICLLTLLLLFAGCLQEHQAVTINTPAPSTAPQPSTSPAGPSPATRDELVGFVKNAAIYARTENKEEALAEFDKKNGLFFSGELYIYAYDFNGTTIAHPVNPEKIGVNRLNERDAKGNLFIRDLRDAALNGSGFVEYYYINPVHGNAVEKKLGYVMKVDDSWWLGSGIYDGTANESGTSGNRI